MIKMILAFASAVEVVSTVYRHGMGQIGNNGKTLADWMDRKGYQV
jgi:dihydroorotate dehydrogenase (fumarate)